MLKETRVNITISYYPASFLCKCFVVGAKQLGVVLVLGGKVQFIGFQTDGTQRGQTDINPLYRNNLYFSLCNFHGDRVYKSNQPFYDGSLVPRLDPIQRLYTSTPAPSQSRDRVNKL